MLANTQQNITEDMPLAIVWRNPEPLVQVYLRMREGSDPYYGWAEQARRIRVRRANWNAKHKWWHDLC